MMRLGGLLAALSVGACASTPPPACPAGQEHLRTAQLFLGRKAPAGAVSEADLRRFVDEEITPRFPDGVTVLEGGGQWRGSENQLIREATKVVLIVLPRRDRAEPRVEAVRAAYKARFNQDAGFIVTQAACVEL